MWYGLIMGLLLGAIFGSYLTVVTYRWPLRVSLGGRSQCPVCGRQIENHWNVPIVAYLLLRGRTHCCGAHIPSRYFLLEVSCALAAAALGALVGAVLIWAVFVALVLAIAGVSVLHRRM